MMIRSPSPTIPLHDRDSLRPGAGAWTGGGCGRAWPWWRLLAGVPPIIAETSPGSGAAGAAGKIPDTDPAPPHPPPSATIP